MSTRAVRLGLCAAALMMSAGAAPPPRTVLFQGDSITDGGRAPGTDLNHIMGQSYAYIAAAEIGAEHPDCGLTFVNRGISGNNVADLDKRWAEDTIKLRPDVVSILIGVNDAFFSSAPDPTRFEETYTALIAETKRALPHSRIIVGEPFILAVGRHQASYAQDRLALRAYQQAVRRLATREGLLLIPYQQLFDEALRRAPAPYWSWDGVHPTYAGHGLMAAAWQRAALGQAHLCG